VLAVVRFGHRPPARHKQTHKHTDRTDYNTLRPGAAEGKEKWGVKHTPMASAGARAYNGGLGAEPPAGVQGAEPPVGVKGAKPPCSRRG